MVRIREVLALTLTVAVIALGLAGCKHNGEHPHGEHPSSEHPASEHPSSEHPG